MRKREEFAVSLRKENKRIKLNEKRAKIGTKIRPGSMPHDSFNTTDLLTSHACISDPSMSPVLSHKTLIFLFLGGQACNNFKRDLKRDRARSIAYTDCSIKAFVGRHRHQLNESCEIFGHSMH